jgi:hypothetical protein
MQDIDISEYINKFSMHLQNNPRAILSARFGDGKTTFLKKFEEKTQDENFILKIYPVNYSVANNEDVFEYIKHDILIQLLQDTRLIDDFQLDEDSIWDAIKHNIFTIGNAVRAIKLASLAVPASKPIADLLTFILKKVKSDESISEAWKEYMEKKVSMSKYLDHFAQMQGGLYEEDGYTLLIKEALKRVKQRKILIIEDLDRIDPKHLFRILNVLGAHVDENNNQNKFGFDNIVIVLDYDVTDSIFHHMYGDKANYPGYMSKFLSSYPFTFSISQVAYTKVYKFIEQKCNIRRDDMRKFELRKVNLGGVSFDQFLHELSVRDIAHALDGIESQLIPDDKIQFKGIEYSVDIPIFWLIALLKRLRGNISVSLVQTGLLCLEAETILNTLGVMMLGSNINFGSFFSFRNEVFSPTMIDDNEHNVKRCIFNKNQVMLSNINVNMDQAIRHAISESFKHVVDVEVE